MNNKKHQQDHYNILREIDKKKLLNQRQLAKGTGLSLGKLNYCLKALKEKGLVKIKNFHKNPNKIGYIYILTPKGVSVKTRLTINFMKKKQQKKKELLMQKQQKKRNLLKKKQQKKN